MSRIRFGTLLWLIVWALPAPMHNDAEAQPAKRPQVQKLSVLASRLAEEHRAFESIVDSLTQSWNLPRFLVDSSGVARELVRVENGFPIFYQTHNQKATLTAGADALQPGGRSGLELTGSTRRLALWDAGLVLEDHVEFGGRVIPREVIGRVLNHSTHVAGTLIASGVNPKARGFAPNGKLVSYDWNNDANEMAGEAAEGLVVSNHSYGIPAGWISNLKGDGRWAWLGQASINTQEDFRFGLYVEQSRIWDEITANAPSYVIVKSVGNERADAGAASGEPYWVFDSSTGKWVLSTEPRQPDGGASGYDSILDSSVSKNVITVGAVHPIPGGYMHPSDVVMTDFSGWGPTDDGRIKPDLVADGVQVFSTLAGGNTSYGTSSGSSMAAPSVAGTVVLIQELFDRLHPEEKMLSSTIKALLIHTAREAGGAPGPDYRFGWGLLNAEYAAAMIVADDAGVSPDSGRIIEGTLVESDVLEFPVRVHANREFRATLAWTDPPDSVGQAVLNDPKPTLVNDLDLRVTGPDGVVLPWTLNRANPDAAAERNVNHTDNVEQVVYLPNRDLDIVVRVSHSDLLAGGTQDFGLVLGVADPVMNGDATASISGRVLLGSAPVGRARVSATGPVSMSTETTSDGVYSLGDLPVGTYSVTVSAPHLTFAKPTRSLLLLGTDAREDFQATGSVLLKKVTIIRSNNLLSTGELDGAQFPTTLAAGGVYGASLQLQHIIAEQLVGGRVTFDWSYDPFAVPYISVMADSWLELGKTWRLSKIGSILLKKRIPALWTSSDMPIGTQLRVPFQVFDRNNRLAGADTLSLLVDRTDDVAPLIFPVVRFEGRNFVPLGEGVAIEMNVVDGSPIQRVTAILFDRDVPERILKSLPLRDSGDTRRDQDLVPGDGIFTGVFFPEEEADIGLRVVADDIAGNRIDKLTDRTYTSRPFAKTADVLLLSRSEAESQTTLYRSALSRLGIAYDDWEFSVRGAMPQDIMDPYPVVVWSMREAPFDREENRLRVEKYLDTGGSLLLMGEHVTRTTNSAGWIRNVLHLIAPSSTVGSRTLTGEEANSFMAGFEGRLSETATPDALGVLSPATAILNADDPVAISFIEGSAHVIVSSVGPGSLQWPDQGVELLSRMLNAVTLGGFSIPGPGPITLLQPEDAAGLSAGNIRFEWTPSPYARSRIQVSSEPAGGGVLLVDSLTTDRSLTAMFTDTGTRYYWRVRSEIDENPGEWSNERWFEVAETANRAPTVTQTLSTMYFRVGDSDESVDLNTVFLDPDGDPLLFEAASSDESIIAVSIQASTLILSPGIAGTATILLAADDGRGHRIEADIPVSVEANQAPTVASSVPILNMVEGFKDASLWLPDLFSDPENDPLAITAESADTSIATVHLDEAVLIAHPVGPGDVLIEAMADDGRGGRAFAQIAAHVRVNLPPRMAQPLPADLQILSGSVSVSIDLDSRYVDPEGDPIEYDVILDPPGVASARIDQARTIPGFLEITPLSTGTTALQLFVRDTFGATTVDSSVVSVRKGTALSLASDEIPSKFELFQNYPNPFRGQTTLGFALPTSSDIRLRVYSVLGTQVADVLREPIEAGVYRLEWRPSGLAGGTYFLVIETGDRRAVRSMILLR